MKKILSLLLIVAMLSLGVTAFAEGRIFVDKSEVKTDTPSQIINDRTMIPVRAITETIGYAVFWNPELKQVDVCTQGYPEPVISMVIGSKIAYTYGPYDKMGNLVKNEKTLDSPAVIVNGRTLVPLRFISESLDYKVDYDPVNKDVYLFSPEFLKDVDPKPLTKEENDYLLSLKTSGWLKLSEADMDKTVDLIARILMIKDKYIIRDNDDFKFMLNRQMEQYSKNKVEAGVLETVCDIYQLDYEKYTK